MIRVRRAERYVLRVRAPQSCQLASRSYSAIWPTGGWVPAPSHVPLTALLIANGDAGLRIRTRWRRSRTSAPESSAPADASPEAAHSTRRVRADRIWREVALT